MGRKRARQWRCRHARGLMAHPSQPVHLYRALLRVPSRAVIEPGNPKDTPIPRVSYAIGISLSTLPRMIGNWSWCIRLRVISSRHNDAKSFFRFHAYRGWKAGTIGANDIRFVTVTCYLFCISMQQIIIISYYFWRVYTSTTRYYPRNIEYHSLSYLWLLRESMVTLSKENILLAISTYLVIPVWDPSASPISRERTRKDRIDLRRRRCHPACPRPSRGRTWRTRTRSLREKWLVRGWMRLLNWGLIQ